jgi:hypothetical protein
MAHVMRTFWHDDLAQPVSGAATSSGLVLDVVVVIRAERTRVAGGAG